MKNTSASIAVSCAARRQTEDWLKCSFCRKYSSTTKSVNSLLENRARPLHAVFAECSPVAHLCRLTINNDAMDYTMLHLNLLLL